MSETIRPKFYTGQRLERPGNNQMVKFGFVFNKAGKRSFEVFQLFGIVFLAFISLRSHFFNANGTDDPVCGIQIAASNIPSGRLGISLAILARRTTKNSISYNSMDVYKFSCILKGLGNTIA
jgi:hypothetical protein